MPRGGGTGACGRGRSVLGRDGEGPAGTAASLEDGESDHSLIVQLFLLLENVPIYALKI